MPKLLKNGAVLDNPWQVLNMKEAAQLPVGPCLLPLDAWLEQASELAEREETGVWLDSDQEPERLAEYFKSLHHIAINFPAFTDGRGFSLARLIRERYGYRGELRTIGQILPDQLHYLYRCGFDAFTLDDAIDAGQNFSVYLNAFDVAYQTCTRQTQPLFRRRLLS